MAKPDPKLAQLRHGFLSSPEELIDEARNGRMFILVDDEDRENEGDLVIPAQMATPDAINFMATHGRGLICLALTKSRVDQLGLDLMSRKNGTRHETAFTVSIEAREGVTTGISAADRARTVAVAIDAAQGAEEIVTPGHVFPLVPREGGVLVRAGHTEAAVDVARLAGLNPSGVICEIMNEDGTMARLDDLVAVAQRHNIKIGLQYLEAWLGGQGCVPLYNLMEDAATAEISRAQVWQWIRHQAPLDDGQPVSRARFEQVLAEELAQIQTEVGETRFQRGKFGEAQKLFTEMALAKECPEFLTLPAYEFLLALAA